MFSIIKDSPPYEAASEIKYLDMVVQESMRLYPVGPRSVRVCNKDVTINGVHFPKGAWVIVPMHVLHKDPSKWEEPEKFDPSRSVHIMLIVIHATKGKPI